MKNKNAKRVLLLLTRLSMGWIFFYAGITKVLNPEWTAAGFLKGAKTFNGFYSWLASDGMIGFVNFLNEWGLTLLGVSLILGALVKLSSYCGALLMLLYYFPSLDFPMAGAHSFLIDEHIIYILLLLFFVFVKAGRIYGLDEKLEKMKFFEKLV